MSFGVMLLACRITLFAAEDVSERCEFDVIVKNAPECGFDGVRSLTSDQYCVGFLLHNFVVEPCRSRR